VNLVFKYLSYSEDARKAKFAPMSVSIKVEFVFMVSAMNCDLRSKTNPPHNQKQEVSVLK
jgi:hypothetical protein